jgi:catechol 2,3-dioxygenase-like lactoylglutathione lyase family enzyme
MSDLVFISPFFIVADLEGSVSFYVDKLGFGVQYIGPEEGPYFAMIGRGPISLMLKSSGQPAPNHTRYNWARWDAFISVTDPDALFEEYRTAGVLFSQPIHDNTDNLRGFELADTDGYVLFFGRPKA